MRLVLAVAGAAILASPAPGRVSALRGRVHQGRLRERRRDRSRGALPRAWRGRRRGRRVARLRRLLDVRPPHRHGPARLRISTLDVDYFGPTPPPGKKGFCNGFGNIGDPFFDLGGGGAGTRRPHSARPPASGMSVSSAGRSAAASRSRPQPGRAHPGPSQQCGFSTGSHRATALAPELPPTILLSGGRTDAIPLAETLPLYRALRAAHVPSELYVYPRGSHNWPGRQRPWGLHALPGSSADTWGSSATANADPRSYCDSSWKDGEKKPRPDMAFHGDRDTAFTRRSWRVARRSATSAAFLAKIVAETTANSCPAVDNVDGLLTGVEAYVIRAQREALRLARTGEGRKELPATRRDRST